MENIKSFNYKDRKYNVVAYDPNWQKRFLNESKILRKIFGNEIQIEHIGSTSVVGMEGKPCIDILVIPQNLEIVKEHISDMENAGYFYRGAFIREDTLLFTRIRDKNIETNVHFLPVRDQHINEMLTLRDYLRKNSKEVSKYSELKKNYMKNTRMIMLDIEKKKMSIWRN